MTDKQIVEYLVELIAVYEGGTTVLLAFDDVTRDYMICLGYPPKIKLLASAGDFRSLCDIAQANYPCGQIVPNPESDE